MSEWKGKKLLAVAVISIVAIALFAGAAVAAASYLDSGHRHRDGDHGEYVTGEDCTRFERECHEGGEEPCEWNNDHEDCPLRGEHHQHGNHDCFEDHREGERDSLTGNRHGCL